MKVGFFVKIGPKSPDPDHLKKYGPFVLDQLNSKHIKKQFGKIFDWNAIELLRAPTNDSAL